jgi:proline iminopeptidase
MLLALALAAVGVAGAFLLRRMMNAPLFEPGTVEARVQEAGESLDPPHESASDGAWQVTSTVSLRRTSTGEGDDILLIHGGPGYPPREPWKATDLIARSYRVHAYDQRGCGGSTRPITVPPDGTFYTKLTTIEAQLGLAAQLADIERTRRLLGRERLILVGHSFGALIAALYAAEFPSHVRALILVAPAPLVVMPKDGPDLFALVRAKLPEDRRATYDAYLGGYFDLRALMDLDEMALSRYFGQFRDFYAAATGGRTVPNGGDVGGFMTLGVFASLGRAHDWRAALRRIDAPTLVLHGADDLQPESDSRLVAGAIPHAQVEVIRDSGHFPPDDAPEAFADEVLRFLRRVP